MKEQTKEKIAYITISCVIISFAIFFCILIVFTEINENKKEKMCKELGYLKICYDAKIGNYCCHKSEEIIQPWKEEVHIE